MKLNNRVIRLWREFGTIRMFAKFNEASYIGVITLVLQNSNFNIKIKVIKEREKERVK